MEVETQYTLQIYHKQLLQLLIASWQTPLYFWQTEKITIKIIMPI